MEAPQHLGMQNGEKPAAVSVHCSNGAGQRCGTIRKMNDALFGLMGIYSGALVIWLIIRIVNRRSIAPICAAAVPVPVLMVFRGWSEVAPVLNRVLPEVLLVGGILAFLGSPILQRYRNIAGAVVHSQRFSRWHDRLFGPESAGRLQAEWQKHAVVTRMATWTNAIGSLALIALAVCWMALR